jgi:hypothetical protein
VANVSKRAINLPAKSWHLTRDRPAAIGYAACMTAQEMPIFTRTYDFLTWLLPATNHFPRAHRHTFTQQRDTPRPIPPPMMFRARE